MQDSKEIIMDSYNRHELIDNAISRMRTLKILGYCYLRGQLEHVNSLLDTEIIKGLTADEQSVLSSYHTFRT